MPQKSTERVRRFRQRNPWYRPLEYAMRRCTDPKHKDWKWYGGAGIKCFLTVEEVRTLYVRDDGHLLQKPSIDRLNSEKDYTFSNCRFIELEQNVGRRNNSVPFDMSPEFVGTGAIPIFSE